MKTLLLSLLILLSTQAFAQFRNTTWGMSKEEVKKIEDSKPSYENANTLIYLLNLDDLKCMLEYKFSEVIELKSINYNYVYKNNKAVANEVLLNRIAKQIEEKYNKPTSKPTNNTLIWDLKGFSIKAIGEVGPENNQMVKVTYTPKILSLEDFF